MLVYGGGGGGGGGGGEGTESDYNVANHTAQNNTLWSSFHHKVCIFLLCGM